MHLQLRTVPAASPPDVEKILGVLSGIDLAGIGGSNVEFGGEIAIVPKDGQELDAMAALDAAGYKYRVVHSHEDGVGNLRLVHVKDEPGGLYVALKTVAAENLGTGRIIRDILVGIPEPEDVANNTIPVHIYSEQVRNVASLANPD